MRRPRLHRPTPATSAWARPYSGVASMAVFYNGDPNTPPAPAPAPAPADPPKPGPPPAPTPAAGGDEEKVTITQRRLNVIMRDEKEEGRRAALRFIAESVGINPDEFDPTSFGEAFKQAEQARKAQLTEEQRRTEELAKKEREAEARIAAAEQREAEAARRDRESKVRAALVRLGASGDDLDDATALMRVADDADDAAITEAADALKARRAELFGAAPAAPQTLPPAPSGAPAGGPPRIPAAGKDAIKTAARERAARMGLRTDDAA